MTRFTSHSTRYTLDTTIPYHGSSKGDVVYEAGADGRHPDDENDGHGEALPLIQGHH